MREHRAGALGDLKYRCGPLSAAARWSGSSPRSCAITSTRAEKYERPASARRGGAPRAAGVRRRGTSRKEASRDVRGTVAARDPAPRLRYALRRTPGQAGFTAGVVLTLAWHRRQAAMFASSTDCSSARPPSSATADRRPPRLSRLEPDGRPAIERGMEFAPASSTSAATRSPSTNSPRSRAGASPSARARRRGAVRRRGERDVLPLLRRPRRAGPVFRRRRRPDPRGKQASSSATRSGKPSTAGAGTCSHPPPGGPDELHIIGVAPEGFVGVGDRDVPAVYVPITAYAFAPEPAYPTMRTWSWMELLVRRKPEVSLERRRPISPPRSSGAGRPTRRTPPGSRWSRPIRAPSWGRCNSRAAPGGERLESATWVSGVALIVLLIAAPTWPTCCFRGPSPGAEELALRLALG